MLCENQAPECQTYSLAGIFGKGNAEAASCRIPVRGLCQTVSLALRIRTVPLPKKQGETPLETFTDLKEFAENPNFQKQKPKNLSGLTDDMMDMPIIPIIRGFNELSCCFTLQSCYGHFVYEGQRNPKNLDPLPASARIGNVEYRIAYIAFCIENSTSGRLLREALQKITAISKGYVQFGCAEWFWNRQVNSYALQVEPDRFKCQDTAVVEFREALHIEKIRNEFFIRLSELLGRTKNNEMG